MLCRTGRRPDYRSRILLAVGPWGALGHVRQGEVSTAALTPAAYGCKEDATPVDATPVSPHGYGGEKQDGRQGVRALVNDQPIRFADKVACAWATCSGRTSKPTSTAW